MKNVCRRGASRSVGGIVTFAVAAAAVAWIGGSVHADTIIGWDVNGQTNWGTSPLTATESSSGITSITGLTKSSGWTTSGTPASNAWGGTSFNYATAADAIAANKFVTLGFTVATGVTLNLTTINEDYRRSGTGATLGLWQYALNGGSYADIGTVNFSSTSSSGATISPLDLSGITALQNISAGTTVALRLVAYGASGTGTWYVYDTGADAGTSDLSIIGTAVGGTGPANLVWAPGGSSTDWNTTAGNWIKNSISGSLFVTGDNATFDGTAVNTNGGAVTVAGGGVTAGTVTFNSTTGTYTVSGGNITATTFTKSGASVLALNNAVSAGTISLTGGTLTGTGTLTSTSTPVSLAATAAPAGDGTYGTLTMNNLSINGPSGARLRLDVNTPSTLDTIAVTGALSATGATPINVSWSGTPAIGTYGVITSASNTATAGNFVLIGDARPGGNFLSMSTTSNGLNLVVSASRPVAGTYTFIGTGSAAPWLTGSNWLTGVAGAYDTADFGTANGTGIGINMNTLANAADVGQIQINATNTIDREIFNSSTAQPGTLTLNGVSNGSGGLRGVTNDSTSNILTFRNGTSQNMVVAVRDTDVEVKVTNVGAKVNFVSDLAGPGSIKKIGAGQMGVSGFTNNVPITVADGTLNGYNTTGIANIGSTVTLTTGGGLVINGSSTLGTLTTSAINVVGTANLFFDLSTAGTDLLNVGNLTFGAGNTVNVNLNDMGGAITNGTLTLMTFSGLTGTPSWSVFGPSGSTATYNIVANGGQYDLVISNAATSLIWNGSVSSAWNVATTANFTGPGGSTTYKNGDFVTFSDAGVGANGGAVTIVSSGVNPDTVNVTNTGGTYTFSGGAIGDKAGGTTSFNKSGTGDLILNSSNSFSGTFSQSAGKTTAATLAALGTGSITLTGGTLVLASGGTTSRVITVTAAELQTTADLTLNGALVGTNWVKSGGGKLTLNAPSTQATNTNGTISGGTVVVTAVNANGVSGVGPGSLTLNTGTTFRIDATGNPSGVFVGFKSDGTLGTGLTVNMNDGSTLEGRGLTRQNGGFAVATSGNITFSVPGTGDSFLTGNSIRNIGAGGATSTATVTVTGAGTWQLASGGTSVSAAGTQFSGSWVVAMDNTTGVLSVGPTLLTGRGEVLNALGYQAPTTGSGAYNGPTRPVTINTGTIAFGAQQGNPSVTHPTAISIRSPLTFNGGKFASTGYDYDVPLSISSTGAQFTTTPVIANLGADITITPGATVTALLYDPVAKATAGGRSINIMTDPNAIDPSTSTAVSTNLTWGSNSTLVADATGVSSGFGSLNFSRTSGSVTVGTNAKLQINANAVVTLSGTVNPLADSTTPATVVNVTNNGTLAVNRPDSVVLASVITGTGGVTNLGNGTTTLTGASNYSGVTQVSAGNVIFASTTHHVGALRGNAVALASATVISGTSSGTSKLNSLALSNIVAGTVNTYTSTLDITNNALIVQSADAPSKATSIATLADEVKSGRNGGTWNGTGITSSSIVGNANATMAIVDNADLNLASYGGQTTDTNSVIVTRAIIGDADLSGVVDLGDFNRWFSHVGSSTFSYASGDFDLSGIVDLGDFNAWFSHVGVSSLGLNAEAAAGVAVGGASAVPEPASLAVLALGGAALLGRRRRRA